MAEGMTFSDQTPSYNLVVDLDRTLFDTNRFTHDVAETLEAAFHINARHFIHDIPNHYLQTGANLRTYDLFAHTAHLALDADAVEHCLLSTLPARATPPSGYMYPDAPGFISFLQAAPEVQNLSILTYGDTRTQRIKFTLSQAVLGAIPSVITQSPKDVYLRTQHESGRGIIIDDKHIENLPPNFTHIFIDRETAAANAYHSLSDVQSAWPRIMGQLALAS